MALNHSEIIIAGGGLIGLCLAPILAKNFDNIAIIDQNRFTSNNDLNKDLRTIAISRGTKLLLEEYNIWGKIKRNVQPINNIKVLNRSENSKIYFRSENNKTPMGYIIEHSKIKKDLVEIIKSSKKIKIINKFKINNIINEQNNIVVCDHDKKISSKLLIAADGKNSSIRTISQMESYSTTYNQSAIVLNFVHQNNHNSTAYEIFLPNGPIATLPMLSQNKNIFKSSLIWSENRDIAEKLILLNKSYLKDIIEEKVLKYLGPIKKLESIKLFPLSAHICRKFYCYRTAFVGDSAHSIHPIAGQGWNLGMRDVKYLAKALEEHKRLGINIGSSEVLKQYNNMRFGDVSGMFFITHGLNKIFSNKNVLLNKFRSIGFDYIDKNKKITKKLVKFASGLHL